MKSEWQKNPEIYTLCIPNRLPWSVALFNKILFFSRNVQHLPDLGKSIQWPTNVPRPLKPVDPKIQNIFQRWRAFKILSKYPRESWPEMHLKITTLELLNGKRAQWGIHR